MFTGLVEEVGSLLDRKISPAGPGLVRVRIGAHRVLEGTRPGDSISVSGCCVTAVELDPGGFTADLVPETLGRTVLGLMPIGCPVNLERAVPVNGRLGGHRVLGHVDGTARVLASTDGPGWRRLRIGLPADLAPLVAEKGSVAVDGVSLTVALVGRDWFEVELIPTTLATTAFGAGRGGPLDEGALVNLEADVDARNAARRAEFTPAVLA